MPPSKEVKPSVSPVEEATDESKAEKMSENSPDARKKTGPPPTPPNKPSSMSNVAEASQPRPSSHPPTPPSKETKPSHPAAEPDQEIQSTTHENKEKEEDNKKEAAGTAVAEQLISKEALPSVRGDEHESQVSEEESGEIRTSGIDKASDNEPQTSTEPLRKSPSPSPLLTPKKKPEKLVEPDTRHIEDKTTVAQPNEGQDSTALLQTASDTSASSPQAEEALPKSEVPSVVVSLNDPVTDSLSLSPLLAHLPEEKKKKKTEEKSVDSGQHSDDDSSESEDTLATSTAALSGSRAGLDLLDASEDDVQIAITLRPTPAAASKPQVRSKVFPCRRSEPIPPLKPSTKARSASSGDLLSDSSICIQARPHNKAAAGSGNGAPRDDVTKLEAEVALEMEKTSALLSRVSQSQGGGDGEGGPEDLLAKAMEKLKAADHVLREVKKLKPAKDSNNRKSW